MEGQTILANIRIVEKTSKLNPCLVEVDSEQMKQIIINLIRNAIEAMPDGGDIIISCHMEDKLLVFSIQDEGVGISEEIKSKIFEPFFSTKRKEQVWVYQAYIKL